MEHHAESFASKATLLDRIFCTHVCSFDVSDVNGDILLDMAGQRQTHDFSNFYRWENEEYEYDCDWKGVRMNSLVREGVFLEEITDSILTTCVIR